MVTCWSCRREVSLPFLCRRCGRQFCVEHRLPEAHGCRGGATRLFGRFRGGKAGGSTALGYVRAPSQVGRSSATEIKHLLVAAGVFFAVELSWDVQLIALPVLLLTILLGVLAAFLIHEYAHKLVAQSYGYWAEFRLSPMGAILSLMTVLLPFKIIAPGAVMIYGQFIAKEDVGRISAAGPFTNLLQSSIATLIYVVAPPSIISVVGLLLASVNADLALFNLMPVAVFDGKKIFDWNRLVWLLLFALTISLWVYARFLAPSF